MQQIKSILIGWVETNDLAHSFIKIILSMNNKNIYKTELHIPIKYFHELLYENLVGIINNKTNSNQC